MAREDSASQARSQRRIAADIAWEGALAGLGNADAAARLLEMSDASVSWPDVVSAARRLRLAPLFHLGLHGFPALRAAVPPSEAERLRQAAHAAVARVARLEQACAEVVAAATSAGIRVIVLKGLALGALVYPSPGARPMEDADLLVAAGDRERLALLLRNSGYRNDLRGEEDFFLPGKSFSLDLHTGLVNTTRIPARRALWPGTFEELWTRGQGFALAGVPARTLGPCDTLLHLALHAVHHHGLGGMLWMADLLACVRAWASALRETADAPPAIRRSLWYCLEALAARGQDPAPEIRAAIRPHRVSPAERWALSAIHVGGVPEAIRYAFTLACLPGWSHRMAFLRQLLFPDASIYTKGFEPGGRRRLGWIGHWHVALHLGRDGCRSVFSNRK